MAHAWDLPLVVKTRAKHGDPFWLKGTGDECVYPLTSLKLLSASKLMFHFNSGAGLEARLYSQVTCVNWPPKHSPVDHLPGQAELHAGVWTKPLTQVIGFDDTNTGRRVLEVIEGL